jgi:hypothetical protein
LGTDVALVPAPGTDVLDELPELDGVVTTLVVVADESPLLL